MQLFVEAIDDELSRCCRIVLLWRGRYHEQVCMQGSDIAVNLQGFHEYAVDWEEDSISLLVSPFLMQIL